MPLVDTLDTFYDYVRSRLATINQQRVVAGHLLGADWPVKNIKLESFYLMTMGNTPIGRQGFSPAIPIVYHEVMWLWQVLGADLVAGQVGANRGVRFRTHFQMKEEMRQALYPYFCQKQTYTMQQNGAALQFVGTPVEPAEWIGWAPPTYREKLDRDSGKVDGMVAVRIWDMTDPILA